MRARVTRSWAGLLFAALLVLMLAVPTAASAHATLMSIDPADESTVAGPVDAIVLTFSENVSVAFGGTKVFGPSGSRVDDGDATVRDKVVTIPIDGSDRGTYALSYRFVSADGHPIHGASTFHRGERSENDASEQKALAASAGDRGVEIAYGAVRGVTLLALLLLAGGTLFCAWIAPGVRARWLGTALLVAMVGAAASYVLDAANAAGFTVLEAMRWDVLRAEAGTTWGRSALLQIGSLIGIAIWMRLVRIDHIRRGPAAIAVALPAFLPLLAWSMGGHALATDPVWLRLPLDMLHMVAAAVWFGGLVQLLAYVRRGGVAVAHVERWSRVAAAAVGTLIITGLYASWREIGLSVEAFIDTAYGRLVLAKALLLIAAMPLAWINRRHNVPGLRSGRLPDGSDPRVRLGRYVAGELVILVLVIAATAALIQTPPAKTAVQPGLVEQDVALGGGAHAQVIFDPARVGSNEIHVYAFTKSDRIDDTVGNVELTGDGPNGIQNLDMKLLPSGPGHFTTPGQTIPFAGDWTFTIVVERGQFDAATRTFDVKIGAAR